MRYHEAFIATNKKAKEHASVNATLLQKAGFVHQVMSGVYTFLPLGLRVLNKIEAIVRDEMKPLGTELLMTALAPEKLTQQTGRDQSIDVLLEARAANTASQQRHGGRYILNATHEELATSVVQPHRVSYKEFPFAVYQIQTKFRNEERSKSGLLRGREFRMKDMYSFHTSAEDLDAFYTRAQEAYFNVFKRLGLGDDTYLVIESGGFMSKYPSHQFSTKCTAGEDVIYIEPTTNTAYNSEVAPVAASEWTSPDTEEKPLEEVEGIGLIGVEPLAKHLGIPVEQTTKTMLFEGDDGRVIAAAVRGDYNVNEVKLKAIADTQLLTLATPETIAKVTGAEVGYAGLLNLPEDVEVYLDDSMQGRMNFECGANRTNYHTINVNFGRDLLEPEHFYDIKEVKEGDHHPETNTAYETFKASEVGNIFPLQRTYSDVFDYTFKDEKGTEQPVIMGSYGIGTSRVMGVIVEKFHDEKGIIWPASVAPYDAHLVGLNPEDEAVRKQTDDVYEQLQQAGIDVLYDDRLDASPGEKLSDADLIGCPWRLVVSKKTDGKVELKARSEKDFALVSVTDLIAKLS